MNSVDKKYFDLLRYILKNGKQKTDRTGTGTLSIFGYDMRFNMNEGFPLLTSKKMAWKSMVIELLWFLRGDTNIKWLVDNGCNIWVGDAYKHYCNEFKKGNASGWTLLAKRLDGDLPEEMFTRDEFIEFIKMDNEISGDFAKKWGKLGPVYGSQWRKWKGYCYGGSVKIETESTDQISNLINDLKNNPDSRRLMVNAWNVAELDKMILPPCHYGFQCYTRELSLDERKKIWDKKVEGLHIMLYTIGDNSDEAWHKKYDEQNIPKRALSLKWSQRSVDSFLGLPFNIASYGLLLTILSKEVNMIPEDLIFSGGDCHIYLNHINQCKQQLKQSTFRLPTVSITDKPIFELEYSDFKLNNYQSAAAIKGELSN